MTGKASDTLKHHPTVWAVPYSRNPLLEACNYHNKPMQRHFYRPVYFRYFPREIGQFQSTLARFGEDKTMQPLVNMSTSCRHVNISPCLLMQLVTEVPVGIWIRNEFKLKIDRSVKTPCQEYGVVAGSKWWAPAYAYAQPSHLGSGSHGQLFRPGVGEGYSLIRA